MSDMLPNLPKEVKKKKCPTCKNFDNNSKNNNKLLILKSKKKQIVPYTIISENTILLQIQFSGRATSWRP